MTRLHWQRKIYSAVGSFVWWSDITKQQRVRLPMLIRCRCRFSDLASTSHEEETGPRARRLRASSRALCKPISLNIYSETICPNKICPRDNEDNRLEVRLRRLSEGKCNDSETIISVRAKELGSDFSFRRDEAQLSRTSSGGDSAELRKTRGSIRLAMELLDYIKYRVSVPCRQGKADCQNAPRLFKGPSLNNTPLPFPRHPDIIHICNVQRAYLHVYEKRVTQRVTRLRLVSTSIN